MADPVENLVGDFDEYYERTTEPVFRRMEASTTGADYGASSYTTRDQADRLSQLLGLAQGKLLLDFGCGTGWPGLYLAHYSGCDVVLTDLSLGGLRQAAHRRKVEGLSGGVVAATASLPPFRDRAFDAVSSSDVFC